MVLWFSVAVVWLFALVVIGDIKYVRHWSNVVFPLVLLAIITTVTAAYGNYDIIDKEVYSRDFIVLSFTPASRMFESFSEDGREPAFILFGWVIGAFTHSADAYYLLIAGLCTAALIGLLFALLGSAWEVLFVFFLTLAFGFFTDYTSYILRQILSLLLILAAFVAFRREKKIVSVACLLLAVLFHWSAIPAAVLILIIWFVKVRIRILVGVWAVLSILYLTKLNAVVFSPFTQDSEFFETYNDVSLSETYSSGTNRLDFWLLSFGVLVFTLWVLRKNDDLPKWYQLGVQVYIVLNCYYLALGYVYFSDRIAAYSWSFIPLLVSAPVLALTGNKQRLAGTALLLGFIAWGIYFGSFHTLLDHA